MVTLYIFWIQRFFRDETSWCTHPPHCLQWSQCGDVSSVCPGHYQPRYQCLCHHLRCWARLSSKMAAPLWFKSPHLQHQATPPCPLARYTPQTARRPTDKLSADWFWSSLILKQEVDTARHDFAWTDDDLVSEEALVRFSGFKTFQSIGKKI